MSHLPMLIVAICLVALVPCTIAARREYRAIERARRERGVS